MKPKKIALVVPSIRKDSFERFCDEWRPMGLFDSADLLLIEDNPTKTFEIPSLWDHALGGFCDHFAWDDIDRYDWSWIIPRRSDTIRSFGYWLAWKNGYDYLMTLDDDCYPADGYEKLVDWHLKMLDDRTRWFNTLNNVTPRGIPYKNLGHRPVYVNHGLWQGVLDYDAPHQLVDPRQETYTHDNRIVPQSAYFPFCGMNWMCRREAIPLTYHLLMGRKCDDFSPKSDSSLIKLPYDRFGDIWAGIIMKRICDHLGWSVSSGTPYIHHDRASNPFTNLRKEANGIETNEWFWEKIDAVTLDKDDDTPVKCYQRIAKCVSQFKGEHGKYWSDLGIAMLGWSELFVTT